MTQAPRGRNEKANRQTENSKRLMQEGKPFQAHRPELLLEVDITVKSGPLVRALKVF